MGQPCMVTRHGPPFEGDLHRKYPERFRSDFSGRSDPGQGVPKPRPPMSRRRTRVAVRSPYHVSPIASATSSSPSAKSVPPIP